MSLHRQAATRPHVTVSQAGHAAAKHQVIGDQTVDRQGWHRLVGRRFARRRAARGRATRRRATRRRATRRRSTTDRILRGWVRCLGRSLGLAAERRIDLCRLKCDNLNIAARIQRDSVKTG